MKTKRIGILGGISHESTIKYYELILQKYYQQRKNYYFPEIVIFSLDLQKFTDFEDRGDEQGYIAYIMQGIRSLEKAGAEFAILAANSPHAVFGEIEQQAIIPLLSIVEVTVKNAKDFGAKKLLLMGIKFTMQLSFYQEIGEKNDLEIIVPIEEEQDEINRIIFDELVIGIQKEESKRKLLRIMSHYQVEGVILGCTELPLLLKQTDVSIKLFDTLRLHAEAALEYSLIP